MSERVVVAMDACAPIGELLELAARLAARLDARLEGVLVEDEKLMQLAALPFASELGRLSGTVRPLRSEQVSRTFRTEAERARKALDRAGKRRRLATTFQIRRGRYLSATLDVIEESDIVLLAGRRIPQVPAPRAGRRPVCLYDDASPARPRTLELARAIARWAGAPLELLAPGPDAASGDDPGSTTSTAGRLPAALARAVAGRGCRVLLLPRSLQIADPDMPWFDALECPVMLVP